MAAVDFDPEDLRICKRLDEMTNIIPLLGRADEMGEAEIQQWKVDLCEKMSEHEIKPFTFKRDVESQMASSVPQPETTSNTASLRTEDEAAEPDPVPPEASQQHDRKVYAPFAVSSAPGLDNDTMDASLLMSSDYCPPPVPSELQDLVQMMFDPENAAWLRHSSARKVVAWQRARLVRRMESGMPHDTWRSRLVGNVSSNGKVERRLSPRGTKSSASGKAAVPKWAANLQEAMRHEHARRGWSNEDELLKKMQNKSARPPKSKRHWSEASTSSSTQTLTASGEQRFDIIERVSSVTWSALRIVSIVGAVGVTACVVARRCFGIESVTIGWDWR
ncbi:MAG: hypothetical protein INR71_00140 [Terriglobus roseus]|nr:hypothetical protein [Terriglobus roseus]